MTLTATTLAPPAGADLSAIKAKQQIAWSSGNYAVIGTTLQIVGETLCEAADVRSGERACSMSRPETAMRRSRRRGVLPP
jgi:hypothetical protein